MKTFNAYIIEKLKVTKCSYKTGDELFDFVLYGLKHYPEDELDVKSLKINAEYMHDHSHRIGSVDYIYYSDAPTYKRECFVVVLENGVLIKINDFKKFNLNNCISYLKDTINYIKDKHKDSKIYLFGSSYGGFVILNSYKKIIKWRISSSYVGTVVVISLIIFILLILIMVIL